MKRTRFSMVGHAHIDPVWLWPWAEGCAETLSTFRSALDRMNEFGGWVFAASSAAFYQWVEEIDPDMFREIRNRVREGRWIPVGGWWVEPDCNLPCLESFIRQQLLGQRYFRDRLGVLSETGFNPDSFGHGAMIPQVLRGGGQSGYVFLRPGPHEMGLPGDVFIWRAPDGSEVTACRIFESYNGQGEEIRGRLDRLAGSPGSRMIPFGVGNHGGGPTIETLRFLAEYAKDPANPEILYEKPAAFLARALEEGGLPEVCGELEHHARGCYSAMSGVKAWNRRAEGALLSAETWASTAAVLGLPQAPQAGDFRQAWENVLFNQFHDILAGSSLEECYGQARDQLGEACAIASRIENRALSGIASRIAVPAEGGGVPFAVFNPHGFELCEFVETELFHGQERLAVLDQDGKAVESQRVQPKAVTTGGARLGFFAQVPAMGWRLYRAASGSGPESPSMNAGDTFIENEFYRLEADPLTGCLSALYDKTLGCQVFSGPAARPAVYDDPSDTWSHGVVRWDRELDCAEGHGVRLIERGPLRTTLRMTSRWGESVITQDVSLYRDNPRIDVRAAVDWRERNKLLKLRFPTAVSAASAVWEIPGGALPRPNAGDEEPMGRWVDVSGISGGSPWGLALIGDGLGGGDVNGGDIGLTLLRCPPYAHHDPRKLDPDEAYAWMEQGTHVFRYALLPHRGGWRQAGLDREADAFCRKPAVLRTCFHGGSLPGSSGLLSVDHPGVSLSAFKPSQDSAGVILRARETLGETARAVISLPAAGREIAAQFGPWQIRSWRIPLDRNLPVAEINLLEWTQEEMP